MMKTPKGHHRPTSEGKTELRLERLLGRRVLGKNNQPAGRIEEFRAETGQNGLVVNEYVIGAAGLLERLGLTVGLLFGRRAAGHIARADQLDIRDPDHPRLTCSLAELRKA
jgi:hypothetical protein